MFNRKRLRALEARQGLIEDKIVSLGSMDKHLKMQMDSLLEYLGLVTEYRSSTMYFKKAAKPRK